VGKEVSGSKLYPKMAYQGPLWVLINAEVANFISPRKKL